MTFTSGRLSRIQSRPATTSLEQQKELDAPITLTTTSAASGATPNDASCPFEVTIPATCEPWPTSSSAAPGPNWVLAPFGQQAPPVEQKQACATRSSARSGWSVSTPLSMIAKVTPAPVQPRARRSSPLMSGTDWARCA